MGAISSCQVTGRDLGALRPPAGRLQSGVPRLEVPPAALQLSGLKNELGRDIHKLWFCQTCLLGELLIDWKAPPKSASMLSDHRGRWGRAWKGRGKY